MATPDTTTKTPSRERPAEELLGPPLLARRGAGEALGRDAEARGNMHFAVRNPEWPRRAEIETGFDHLVRGFGCRLARQGDHESIRSQSSPWIRSSIHASTSAFASRDGAHLLWRLSNSRSHGRYNYCFFHMFVLPRMSRITRILGDLIFVQFGTFVAKLFPVHKFVRNLITGISIPSSISLPINTFTRSRVITFS